MRAQQHDELDDGDARIARLEEIVAFQGALLERSNFRIDTVENILGIPVPPDVDRSGLMLKAKEAACKSGYSESAIRKMVKQDRIGYVRCGRKLFITSLPSVR